MSQAMTMTAPQSLGAKLERVLIGGDLSQLTADERVTYYNAVCESVGLNPLTKPFEYLRLNGKDILYARRDATDQLRKIHGVSITIVSRDLVDDVYVVTVRATDSTGRIDESTGVVAVAGLRGETKANALMKAETKSKRRVTLSICGLGMLDETETDSIPGAQRVEQPPVAPVKRPVDVVAEVVPQVGEKPWTPANDDGEPITDEQLDGIRTALLSRPPEGMGWNKTGAKAWLKKLFGVEQPGDLTKRMADNALGLLIHRMVGEEPYKVALAQAAKAGEVLASAGDE